MLKCTKPSSILSCIMIGTLTVALLLAPMHRGSRQELKPPKEIAALAWMIGTWSGSGKIAFGGHETAITTTITVSFDGQFLKAISSDKSSGFTLTKTSMTEWDAPHHQYVSYTFTNIAPTARIEHGALNGNKLVLISEPWEAEGMTTVTRETMSKISGRKCSLMFESKHGDTWAKEMDFVLTKSS